MYFNLPHLPVCDQNMRFFLCFNLSTNPNYFAPKCESINHEYCAISKDYCKTIGAKINRTIKLSKSHKTQTL